MEPQNCTFFERCYVRCVLERCLPSWQCQQGSHQSLTGAPHIKVIQSLRGRGKTRNKRQKTPQKNQEADWHKSGICAGQKSPVAAVRLWVVLTKPAAGFVWSFESPTYPCFFTTRCVFGPVIVQPTFPVNYFLVKLCIPLAACANSLSTVCQILQVFTATDGINPKLPP